MYIVPNNPTSGVIQYYLGIACPDCGRAGAVLTDSNSTDAICGMCGYGFAVITREQSHQPGLDKYLSEYHGHCLVVDTMPEREPI